MAKRFTDTEKWKKPFIRGLQGVYKLLWFYITDDCDHAGIWQVDLEVAEIRIGERIDKTQAEKAFADKIYVFDNCQKWFIPGFISFQYGELNPANRAHNSVIQQLKKNNLMGLISPLEGCKDKDMDKDKDKGDVGENLVPSEKPAINKMDEVYDSLSKNDQWISSAGYASGKKITAKQLLKYLKEFCIEQTAKGNTEKTIREYQAYFINWLRVEIKERKDEVLYVMGQ